MSGIYIHTYVYKYNNVYNIGEVYLTEMCAIAYVCLHLEYNYYVWPINVYIPWSYVRMRALDDIASWNIVNEGYISKEIYTHIRIYISCKACLTRFYTYCYIYHLM